MIPPYVAAALIVVAAIVASGAPLELAGATPAATGCVRLEHEWNGGAQRYRAALHHADGEPAMPDDACPTDSAATFRLAAPTCVDVELSFGTHSPLNGAPPIPTDLRLYVVPSWHPQRHGGFGRDAWPDTFALRDAGVTTQCLDAGDYRLVIRSCRYGPTPMHPASQPQCDGVLVYDINSDDLGRTLPIYNAYHG